VKVRRQARPDPDGGALPPAEGSGRDVPVSAPDHGCTVHEGLHSLIQLLPRITRGLRRSSPGSEGPEHEPLGPRHNAALVVLREQSSTVGALATALDLNLATTSGLVADLERAGFAARSVDPADRRRTIVQIPATSERRVDAWLETATAPLARALQQLSSDERGVLVRAMRHLEAEINSPSSRDGSPPESVDRPA
jgi:DNA-binding MarR family transcriptional regulator